MMRRSVLFPCGRGCKGAWQQAPFVVTRHLWTRVQPFSFASPCNDIGLVVTLPSPRLSGPFRTTPLLLDKAVTPEQNSAIQPCSLMQEKLFELRAQIKKGELDETDYFFTNTEYEGKNVPEVFKPRADLLPDVVRCKECGKTIAEHAASPGVAKPKPKTYDEALKLSEDGGTVTEPRTKSKTLVGRHGFAERIHKVIVNLNPLSTQDSCSLVLQNASGVGKTFATITARRALMELAKRKGLAALDYEPVVVYLGLNQKFQLLGNERAALKHEPLDVEEAVRSVLFQRLNFTLHHTLEAIKAKGSVAAALDSEDPTDWRQRLAEPKESLKDYRFCTDIANRNDDSKVKTLCDDIQKLAQKKLVVLTVLDEVQWLDDCIKPDANGGGGARLALRVLRSLQASVYNQTNGQVLMLPIATGIDAVVSLGPQRRTIGENVILGGRADEALMSEGDFMILAKEVFDKNAEGAAKLTDAQVRFAAYVYYPHVRELLESTVGKPKAVGEPIPLLKRSIKYEQAVTVLNASFTSTSLDRGAFYVGIFPSRSTSDEKSVPMLSFFTWPAVHEGLTDWTNHWKDNLCAAMPFREVTIRDVQNYSDFEKSCFEVLGYFLGAFGPLKLSKKSALKEPLKDWLPVGKITMLNPVVLPCGKARLNPFQASTFKKLGRGAPLTAEFRDRTKEALRMCVRNECKVGVFFWCGGKSPLDYILAVFEWKKREHRVTVELRFADAKHTEMATNTMTTAVVAEVQRTARKVHAALSKQLCALFETKDPEFYEARLFDSGKPATFSCEPFISKHCMVCHNRPTDLCLSPSTFTWSPWSRFLFRVADKHGTQ